MQQSGKMFLDWYIEQFSTLLSLNCYNSTTRKPLNYTSALDVCFATTAAECINRNQPNSQFHGHDTFHEIVMVLFTSSCEYITVTACITNIIVDSLVTDDKCAVKCCILELESILLQTNKLLVYIQVILK